MYFIHISTIFFFGGVGVGGSGAEDCHVEFCPRKVTCNDQERVHDRRYTYFLFMLLFMISDSSNKPKIQLRQSWK